MSVKNFDFDLPLINTSTSLCKLYLLCLCWKLRLKKETIMQLTCGSIENNGRENVVIASCVNMGGAL